MTFVEFPDHVDFVKIITNAQHEANNSGMKIPVEWRGYKSCVAPNLPEFGTRDLQVRLFNALKQISNLSEEEKKVL